MGTEQRVQFFLGAARRAELEGDLHTARILRRMAEEARPLENSRPVARAARSVAPQAPAKGCRSK